MTPTVTHAHYQLFAGVDIAAETFTAAWMQADQRPTRSMTLAQTEAGYTTFQQHLLASGFAPSAILVVMEATGTYWVTFATTLARAGFQVSVINPLQAHAFAKALLKRNKTDAIDAHTLTQLAALLQPAPWNPPPAVYTELQQRLAQRESLLELRQHVRNQRHALVQQPMVIASVRERMDALIATLSQQIGAVEREIAATMRQDAAWAAAADRLQTITGVGMITSAWLLVTTLNFTLCATAEAAVGVCRISAQSISLGHECARASDAWQSWECPLAACVILSDVECSTL
jgi:transposase